VFTSSLTIPAVRIALAILLDAAALIIWDIGTRSPARLLADVRAGLREARARTLGVARFLTGALALVLAAFVSAPVASRSVDFTIVECWALVTALILEQLIGPDLRARRR
jgi:NCAIR mutase (PurE)-related protein